MNTIKGQENIIDRQVNRLFLKEMAICTPEVQWFIMLRYLKGTLAGCKLTRLAKGNDIFRAIYILYKDFNTFFKSFIYVLYLLYNVFNFCCQ